MSVYQNPRRAHRPLLISRQDWFLLDGPKRDPAGLARLEALIREGKGVEAALEQMDEERPRERKK